MRRFSCTAALRLGAVFLSFCAVSVPAFAVLVTPPIQPETPSRELFLAGGALGICSDLAPRACRLVPDGAERTPARYVFDAEGRDRALDPLLWPSAEGPSRKVLSAMLTKADAGAPSASVSGREAEDRLFEVCLARSCAERDPQRPWSVMLDIERAAVLSALEVPQGQVRTPRPRERAHLDESAVNGGVAVLRAFVQAAQARTSERPKIAVVTASALDPMDAVDFYLDAFEALGADAVWWPVDAAVAEARFARGDCAELAALRMERLRMVQRARIYPDLDAYQNAFCQSQPAMMLQVQGVFFSGGDQWRLRQAFVHADDRANDWLLELQQAYAAGRVVVGGTSAGAAVQSASWMLSNGDVEAAVARAARVGAPPEPGCGRAGRCGAIPEDALTVWPAGGLRLASGAIVDTHFSERARELRLLMAMQAADARWGYGADEASALHVSEQGDRREIEALGESGGWVMRRDASMRDEVEAWYLAPGSRLSISSDAGVERVQMAALSAAGVAVDASVAAAQMQAVSAFESGALRAAAQRLSATCESPIRLSAEPGAAELRCVETTMSVPMPGSAGKSSIGPLRLRFLRDATDRPAGATR